MKALVFDQYLYETELPLPTIQSGEALIQIRMAGICNTDLEIMQGYMNYQGILGHEFVGDVISTDNQTWVGKRVTGEINLGCGECSFCTQGLSRHCPNRRVLGIQNHPGVFAEYCVLPIQNLHAVPESISDEEAVWVEPIAAACQILEQIKIKPDHHVMIIGDGKLAQVCARVMQLTGCQLTVYGKHPHKLALLNPLNIKTQKMTLDLEPCFDVVIEASGHPEGLKAAVTCVKHRGTIILKSTTHHQNGPNLNDLVIHEIQLIGSRCGPFEPAIQLLQDKKVSVKELITNTYSFADWKKAFDAAKKKKSIKILLDMRT